MVKVNFLITCLLLSLSAFSGPGAFEGVTMIIASESNIDRMYSGKGGIEAIVVSQDFRFPEFYKLKHCINLNPALEQHSSSNCRYLFGGNFIHKDSFSAVVHEKEKDNIVTGVLMTAPLFYVSGAGLAWQSLRAVLPRVGQLPLVKRRLAQITTMLIEGHGISKFLQSISFEHPTDGAHVVADALSNQETIVPVFSDKAFARFFEIYDMYFGKLQLLPQRNLIVNDYIDSSFSNSPFYIRDCRSSGFRPCVRQSAINALERLEKIERDNGNTCTQCVFLDFNREYSYGSSSRFEKVRIDAQYEREAEVVLPCEDSSLAL